MFDQKYGQIYVPGTPKNEPCILFRAQDAFSVAVLKFYEMLCSGTCDALHLTVLRHQIEQFIAWPVKKIPDTTQAQLNPSTFE